MNEQSKAAKRRFADGAFHLRYFSGRGIDIGGGPDPLGRYVGQFARLTSCRTWDLADGDAEHMAGVPDGTFDFAVSSHCLEHLHDPHVGLRNWLRIIKPSGFLVVTVPDFDLYEGGRWPSRWNADHKHAFSLSRPSARPVINAITFLARFAGVASVERLHLVRDFWSDSDAGTDQTLNTVTESCIEFVLRKCG